MPLKLWKIIHRSYCTALKHYSDIPSPPAIPVLGHANLFFKTGPYEKDRLTEAALDLSQKYGPVFRLQFPGQEFVITTNADDFALLFQTEGQFPYRIKMGALEHYREKIFGAVGLVPGHGEQWHKFRTCLSTFFQVNYLRNHYLDVHRDIAGSLVKYIQNNKTSSGFINDFVSLAMKYAIEAISVVSPGIRIRCLEDNDPVANEVINANCLFMDGLYRTYSQPPIWKYIKTKGYRNMETGHNVINRIVNQRFEELSKSAEGHEKSFTFKLFKKSILQKNEACLLSTEVFLAGIDATATTLSMVLYYLSKNPECQQLAFNDASNINMYYLKACIKETLRLSPTGGGHTRRTGANVILSGYFVPKGTTVTAFNSVTSRMEKYFVKADTFRPERWLRNESEEITRKHRWASLPFGHGPRICPGRRLAEQEILVALAEILKKFQLHTNVDDVGMVYRMNRIPDKHINIKFTERSA